MGSVVDYDKHYRNGRGQCGDPFGELVDFFAGYDAPLRVLDLGCGQGRDAIMIARQGHHVTGVDLSEIGIAQLQQDAAAEGLDIEARVGDVLDFRSRRKFDVCVLDRVLHLLLDDGERRACLDLAARLTRVGGHVLVVETPKNVPLVRRYFDERGAEWASVKRSGGFLFVQRQRSRTTH